LPLTKLGSAPQGPTRAMLMMRSVNFNFKGRDIGGVRIEAEAVAKPAINLDIDTLFRAIEAEIKFRASDEGAEYITEAFAQLDTFKNFIEQRVTSRVKEMLASSGLSEADLIKVERGKGAISVWLYCQC
jgi:predicted transcriptional regulator